MRSGLPFTLIVIRVIKEVKKKTDQLVISKQLAQELLRANNVYAKKQKERKEDSNKVIQKYKEIYGHQARRQIKTDKENKKRVVNIHKKRLQAF